LTQPEDAIDMRELLLRVPQEEISIPDMQGEGRTAEAPHIILGLGWLHRYGSM
jgi:hypothetical protein